MSVSVVTSPRNQISLINSMSCVRLSSAERRCPAATANDWQTSGFNPRTPNGHLDAGNAPVRPSADSRRTDPDFPDGATGFGAGRAPFRSLPSALPWTARRHPPRLTRFRGPNHGSTPVRAHGPAAASIAGTGSPCPFSSGNGRDRRRLDTLFPRISTITSWSFPAVESGCGPSPERPGDSRFPERSPFRTHHRKEREARHCPCRSTDDRARTVAHRSSAIRLPPFRAQPGARTAPRCAISAPPWCSSGCREIVRGLLAGRRWSPIWRAS